MLRGSVRGSEAHRLTGSQAQRLRAQRLRGSVRGSEAQRCSEAQRQRLRGSEAQCWLSQRLSAGSVRGSEDHFLSNITSPKKQGLDGCTRKDINQPLISVN